MLVHCVYKGNKRCYLPECELKYPIRFDHTDISSSFSLAKFVECGCKYKFLIIKIVNSKTKMCWAHLEKYINPKTEEVVV